ncbi:2-oxoacid:acceptor oxidoreductase family protein [candidate division KSB1 bacterium]
MNIRFSGFGGQGIVLSGVILGTAAVYDSKNAIQTQSYGSEARGGACKCDVIIDEKTINELEPDLLDILIAFSQPAFNEYFPYLKKDGILFIDKDLVSLPDRKTFPGEVYTIPATDLAFKKLNHKIMANLVMMGYVIRKTGLLDVESVEQSIRENAPQKFVEANLNAFRTGLELD